MKKRVFAIVMLTAAAFTAGWLIYDAAYGKMPTVKVSEVQCKAISSLIETTGVFEPAKQYNVMPETGGKIINISVKEGQLVRRGQVVMNLDPSMVKSQLAQAQIALEIETQNVADMNEEAARQKAELAMAMAQGPGMDLERFNDSMAAYNKYSEDVQDSIAAWNDNSQTVMDTSAADKKIKLAQMKVEDLKRQIDRFTLRSMIDGKVLAINGEIGELAGPGAPVVVVGDTKHMIVKTLVGENDLQRIEIGQKAEIYGDTLAGKTIQGTVKRVKPIASRTQNQQGSITFGEIEIEPIIKDLDVVPGVSADVNIICQHKDKTNIIPIEALVEQNGKYHVFTVKEGKIQQKEVTTGIRNDFYVEILHGINGADRIVMNPAKDITDGIRVRTDD